MVEVSLVITLVAIATIVVLSLMNVHMRCHLILIATTIQTAMGGSFTTQEIIDLTGINVRTDCDWN